MSGGDYNPNSIDSALSRIETNQQSHTAQLRELKVSFDEHKRNIEHRVAKIERWKYWLTGAAAAAGAGVSAVLDIFKK